MNDERDLPRPVGGPTLSDGSGAVKVTPRCSVCSEIVDLRDPDHHVCVVDADGMATKTTALAAAATEERTRPERLQAAEAAATKLVVE